MDHFRKMNCVLFVILSISIVISQGAIVKNYGKTLTEKYLGSLQTTCIENGYSCLNCSFQSHCSKLPDGEWDQKIISCSQEENCIDGECKTETSLQCDLEKYEYLCYETGLFPHPFDCKKYSICPNGGNSKSIIQECPEGFGYDPLNAMCRLELNEDKHRLCALVNCNDVNGKQMPVSGNPEMYYECIEQNVLGQVVLRPQFKYCNNNLNFIDGECQDIPRPPVNEMSCIVDHKYIYRNDCRKYLNCERGSMPQITDCPPGQRFIFESQNCEDFEC